MADDERRAEIEAMARAMYEGAHRRWAIDPKTTRWPGAHKSVSFDALDRRIRGAYLDEAADALAALDRVRDARGDDEACPDCWEGRPKWAGTMPAPPCPTCDGTGKRSPQDDDAEKMDALGSYLEKYPPSGFADRYSADGWRHIARGVLSAAAIFFAARSPQGEDHEAAAPTFWPGEHDREEMGPVGDGTPHARMQWFWDRMSRHEKVIAELTGWSPFSSSYRFEEAIADAFDRLSSPSPSRDGTVGEGHGAAEAKVLEVMASPSYATATDEQRAKWIVNHMARDGTVAVEDVREALLRIGERVMTFGGFQRTPRGEFWVARDDVIRLVDELLTEFGVSERTERIHDQATKEKER